MSYIGLFALEKGDKKFKMIAISKKKKKGKVEYFLNGNTNNLFKSLCHGPNFYFQIKVPNCSQ